MKPYYEHAGVTIYHGDCREILPLLSPADMILTSPPYGGIRDYGGHEACDLLGVIDTCSQRLTDGGVMVWNVADQTVNGSETGDSFRQGLRAMAAGLRLHDTMIYCRNAVVFPDSNRYFPGFEYVFVFSRGAPRHFNGIRDRRNVWAGANHHGTRRERDGTLRPATHTREIPELGLRMNWWVLNTAAQDGIIDHPARMPVPLAVGHVQTWSAPGEVVVDPFMGSGTTLLAAKNLGRRAIGIEIEERYCEIAARRLAQEVMPLA